MDVTLSTDLQGKLRHRAVRSGEQVAYEELRKVLMNDFLIAGGVIETREFQSPQDVASVPQRVIINCPGYGGRKLWSDESIVPVRGQIAWLIPQEGAHYSLFYKDLYVVARRDGIVVQPVPGGDDYGWNDANEEPNRQEAEAWVLLLKELFDRMAAMRL